MTESDTLKAVVMLTGTVHERGGGRRIRVPVVAEDVAHVAVLAGVDLQSQHAGRLKPYLAVTFSQRQQLKASAVALLRMPFRAASRVTASAVAGR